MSKFTERLKKAYRSLAVGGIIGLSSSPWWAPVLDAASNGALGQDVQKWAVVGLGVASILGWAVPQKSIPKG